MCSCFVGRRVVQSIESAMSPGTEDGNYFLPHNCCYSLPVTITVIGSLYGISKLFLCSAIAPQNADRTFLFGGAGETEQDFAF